MITRISSCIVLCLMLTCSVVSAADKEGEPATAPSSGIEDQTGVAITIYNVNLGLVKDQRQIRLTKGTGELRFMDVASQIIRQVSI